MLFSGHGTYQLRARGDDDTGQTELGPRPASLARSVSTTKWVSSTGLALGARLLCASLSNK